MTQHTLFGPQMPDEKWPYDMLEVSVQAEPASVAQILLHGMVGTYLPKGTWVHFSTNPIGRLDQVPSYWVIIHPLNGVR